MKKILYIFVALLAITACTKKPLPSGGGNGGTVEQPDNPDKPDEPGDDSADVLKGQITGAEYKLAWISGDKIVANGLVSRDAEISGTDAGEAGFKFEKDIEAPVCAVYPASAYIDESYNASAATMQITIPATQTYTNPNASASAIMLAYSATGKSVSFTPAAGCYKIAISGTDDTDAIKTIKIRKPDGGNIAGTYRASFSESGCSVTEVETTDIITVDCGNGVAQGTDIYVLLPAINYSDGLLITAYDVKGHFHSFDTPAVDFAGESCGKILAKPLAYAPESGTISSAADWEEFCNQFNSGDLYRFVGNGTVVLGNDITLSGGFVRPEETFTYTFDGNGKTITIEGGTHPLFNTLGAGGVIENLITAGTVVGGSESEGKVVLLTGLEGGTVQNCVNNASITVSNVAEHVASAAFVRIMKGGQIIHCINTGDIDISVNATSSDWNCYAAGIVARINGNSNSEIVISNCENSGKVLLKVTNTGWTVGYFAAAGIAAWVSRSSSDIYPTVYFDNCDNSGNILLQASDDTKAYASYVGGIIGIGAGVRSSFYVGAPVASNQNKIFFKDCDNTGELYNKAVSFGAAARSNTKSYTGGLAGSMFGFDAVFNNEATPIFENCTSSGKVVPYDNNASGASERPGVESVAGGFIGIGANLSFKDCTVSAQVGTTSRLAFAVSGGIGLAAGKFRFDGCTFCPKVIMARSFSSAKENWSLIATSPKYTGTTGERNLAVYYKAEDEGLPAVTGSTVKNCNLGSWGLSINTATVAWNATKADLSAIKTKFNNIENCETFGVQGTTSGSTSAYCAKTEGDVTYTSNTGTGLATSQPTVPTTPIIDPMTAGFTAFAPEDMTLEKIYKY